MKSILILILAIFVALPALADLASPTISVSAKNCLVLGKKPGELTKTKSGLKLLAYKVQNKYYITGLQFGECEVITSSGITLTEKNEVLEVSLEDGDGKLLKIGSVSKSLVLEPKAVEITLEPSVSIAGATEIQETFADLEDGGFFTHETTKISVLQVLVENGDEIIRSAVLESTGEL